VFDSGHGLSTEEQEYNPAPIINEIRRSVGDWRNLPNPDQWLNDGKVLPDD
jgi:type III restriction enzyme